MTGRQPQNNGREARCRFLTVDDTDPRLQGRICIAYEEAGMISFLNARSHISEQLAEDFTRQNNLILAERRYLQYSEPELLPRWLIPEERHYPGLDWARNELVPAEDLPDDATCQHIESPAGFVWLIRQGEISGELRREWNAFLALILGDRLWGRPPQGSA